MKIIIDDKRTDVNNCNNNGYSSLRIIIKRTIMNEESLEVLNYILKDKRVKLNIKDKYYEKTELMYLRDFWKTREFM